MKQIPADIQAMDTGILLGTRIGHQKIRTEEQVRRM